MGQKKSVVFLYILSTILFLLIFAIPMIFISGNQLNFDITYECENNSKLFIFRNARCNALKVSTAHTSSSVNEIMNSKIQNGRVRKEIKRLLGSKDNFSLIQAYPLNNQDLTRDIGHLLIFDASFELNVSEDYCIACVRKQVEYKNGILPSRMHAVYDVNSIEYVDKQYFNIKD